MFQIPNRTEAEPRSESGRDQGEGHRADTKCCAQAECQAKSLVVENVTEIPSGAHGVGQRQQCDNDDEVRKDRGPGGGEEASSAVQECVGEAGQAVKQDLDQEDPRQGRADRTEHIGVDALGDFQREQPEDQWRSEYGDRRQCSQQYD